MIKTEDSKMQDEGNPSQPGGFSGQGLADQWLMAHGRLGEERAHPTQTQPAHTTSGGQSPSQTPPCTHTHFLTHRANAGPLPFSPKWTCGPMIGVVFLSICLATLLTFIIAWMALVIQQHTMQSCNLSEHD